MASKESTVKQPTNDANPTEDSNFNKNKARARGRRKNQKPVEAEIREKKKDNAMMDPVEMIFK